MKRSDRRRAEKSATQVPSTQTPAQPPAGQPAASRPRATSSDEAQLSLPPSKDADATRLSLPAAEDADATQLSLPPATVEPAAELPPTHLRPTKAKRHKVALSTLASDLGLEVLADGGHNLDRRYVETADLNRPGLQWSGYLDHFSSNRLQIVGRAEAGYLWSLSAKAREQRLNDYCALGFPAVIITRGLDIPEEALATAVANEIPVFRSPEDTSRFYSRLHWYLAVELAPRTVLHAGLVDVYSAGILIMGKSGAGKSETTLELVRRGHRLIADDTVEVRRPGDRDLIGRSPDLQRHFMEIKGLGIINVKRLYGIGAVKLDAAINLVISLEPWEPGMAEVPEGPGTMRILDLDVPLVRIMVEPGRNLAILIEAVAMDHRSRALGSAAQGRFGREDRA
ncbi:MAG: HPr(Ser) kinase/phosphatase [Candidatus Nanopelagicales bacterium]